MDDLMRCRKCGKFFPIADFIGRDRCSLCRQKRLVTSAYYRATWVVYRLTNLFYVMVFLPPGDEKALNPGGRYVGRWVTTKGLCEKQPTPFGTIQDMFIVDDHGRIMVEVYIMPSTAQPMPDVSLGTYYDS